MAIGKKIAVGVMGVLALAAAYLSLWPVPIDPAAWTPPKAPETVDNGRLRNARRLAPLIHGPEALAVGPDDKLYGA